MNTSPVPRLLAATGALAAICYYLGGHVVQPAGDPSQGMTDAETVQWARDSYGALWAGGVVSLLSALLLLAFGVALADRLAAWSNHRAVVDLARASVGMVSGLLALAGIVQVLSGTGSMPGEKLASESVIPVFVMLSGNLAASAWCLLAPAAACVALAGGAPRSVRVASGLLSILLAATIGLPPVSWAFGLLWLLVASGTLLATSVESAGRTRAVGIPA